MKLADLRKASPEETTTSLDRYKKQLHGMGRCQLLTRLGKGAFGVTYQSPTDTNLAVKTFEINAEYPHYQLDAYMQWVMQCLKRNNPYLPKISDVRVFACAEQIGPQAVPIFSKHQVINMYGVAHIERLQKLGAKRFWQNQYPFNDPDLGFHSPEDLQNAASAQRIAKIARWKDPALYDVITLIRSLRKQFKYNVDTHQDNVMWRSTGDGYHLVFTDPVSW